MYKEMRECFDIYYIRKSFHTFEKIRKGSGTKYVRMFSHILYMKNTFLIYNFAPAPFRISLISFTVLV